MVIISDTSPITNLIQINQLVLLNEIFKKVIISNAVYEELCEIESNRSVLESNNWIATKEASDRNLVKNLILDIDKGEAASIVLAIEMKADILLIDEKKGRKVAKSMGLKVMGLIGILTQAKSKGLISSLKLILDQLITENDFRVHPKLYKEVLNYVDEI